MADNILNFDTAPTVTIIVVKNHSFTIQLTQKDKITGAAVNYVGTPKMVISKDKKGDDILMTLTTGAGITIVTNVMTIQKTTVNNTLSEGSYFYDIRFDSGGLSTHFMKGVIIVNPSQADG